MPDEHGGGEFVFHFDFSEEPEFSYTTLKGRALDVDERQRQQLTERDWKGRIDPWRTGSPTGVRTRRLSWP